METSLDDLLGATDIVEEEEEPLAWQQQSLSPPPAAETAPAPACTPGGGCESTDAESTWDFDLNVKLMVITMVCFWLMSSPAIYSFVNDNIFTVLQEVGGCSSPSALGLLIHGILASFLFVALFQISA